MAKALKGAPEMFMAPPEGVVSVKVNENGMQSGDGKPEFFSARTSRPSRLRASPARTRRTK